MSNAENLPPPRISDETKEIVRVIESDHKATIELIARLTTLRAGIRGVVITLASAVLSLAVAQASWPWATFGIPVVVIGYVAEARMEFLIRLAHDRAVRLERKVQAYLSTLIETGAIQGDAYDSFQREVESYQFGFSRSLRGPSTQTVLKKSLRDVMTWVYAVFLVALAVLAIATGFRTSTASQTRVACLDVGGVVVEIRELPVVKSGNVVLSRCPDASPAPSVPRQGS